jgi:hypothetical protein
MARRWVLSVIVAAALVVAAVVAAHAIRDDDTAARAAATATIAPTTSTTAAPTGTTGAPSTTGAGPTDAGTTTTTSTTTATAAGDTPPGPCGADTGAVRAAVDAAIIDARADADLASCRLAPSDPTWASARLAAKPGATFTPLTVILHGSAGTWTVVARGGTDAGCGSAPQQVIVDLGQFCAGTGGGA